MFSIVASIPWCDRSLFVQRQFPHTVNRIYRSIAHISHTVLRPLQHQARPIHTTHVGTLNRVQQTTSIDGAETELFPIGFISIFIGKMIVILFTNSIFSLILFAINLHSLLTLIFQLKISTLTIRHFLIFSQSDLRIQPIVVSAVVGNVQLTITIHHRQVATTIETTRMLRAHRDEVAVIDIVEYRSSVAKHRCSIGIGLVAVRGHIATRKHSVMNLDTTLHRVVWINGAVGKPVACIENRPFSRPSPIGTLLRQRVQICRRHITVCPIRLSFILDRLSLPHLQIRRHHHLAVFRQSPIGIIIPMARGSCPLLTTCTVLIPPAIHIANITPAKHVAIALGKTFIRSYFTSMNIHLSLSEHIAICVKTIPHAIPQHVVALATTEYVTSDMTIVDFHMSSTSLIDAIQFTHHTRFLLSRATSHGGNLTATMKAVANQTSIHLHMGEVASAQVIITRTEHIATVLQTVVGSSCRMRFVRPRFVRDFLLERVCPVFRIVVVTDISVVERQMSRAINRTALTTTIGIALYSGQTLVESHPPLGKIFLVLVFTDTDDHIRFARYVAIGWSTEFSSMFAHAAPPTATIHITHSTTFDISIRLGCKSGISCRLHQIKYRTTRTCCIDVLDNGATMQTYIRRTADCGIGTETSTIAISTAETPIVHITTDIGTLVDVNVCIGLCTQSIFSDQITIQSLISIIP